MGLPLTQHFVEAFRTRFVMSNTTVARLTQSGKMQLRSSGGGQEPALLDRVKVLIERILSLTICLVLHKTDTGRAAWA